MDRDDAETFIAVEVLIGVAPRQVHCVRLRLPIGSTVRMALDAAQAGAQMGGAGLAGLDNGDWVVGVWGRKERPGHPLRDGDRVELVRRLKVDPKEARRVRYRAHGEKLPKGFHRPKTKAVAG
jgi:putative ubiquitin-RnfH superfamily antitoxin RatB of RatAB toxin-antitoxin module